MGDRYASLANTDLGRTVVRRLGLPDPPRLRRHAPGAPLASGPVLLGAAPGGRLDCPVLDLLDRTGVDVRGAVEDGTRYGALIFDATGILDSTGLRALYDFFHRTARSVLGSGRVVVLGTAPERCGSAREATAQRALEGLVRSIGKEFGRGVTAQLVYVAPGGEQA